MSATITTTRTVTFEWSTEYGTCVECDLPAAYVATGTEQKLCCICAAQAAAAGDSITWLAKDEN